MKIKLEYGRDGLEIDLPSAQTTAIHPAHPRPLLDEADALAQALRNPTAGPSLRSQVKPHARVAISVCDVTRAIPTSRILPVVLKELEGLSPKSVTILVATGTHRPSMETELKEMLD